MQKKLFDSEGGAKTSDGFQLNVSSISKLQNVKLTPYQKTRLVNLVSKISYDLSAIFQHPIQTIKSKKFIRHYAFGVIEYRYSRKFKTFSVHEFVKDGLYPWHQIEPNRVLIWHPLRLTDDLIRIILRKFTNAIQAFSLNFYEYHCDIHRNLYSDNDIYEELTDNLIRLIRREIKRAINWKNIRYELANKLKLDLEVLMHCKLGGLGNRSGRLNIRLYNFIQTNITLYREVFKEAPKVVWLLTLLMSNNYRFKQGAVVSRIRNIILDYSIPPLGWRILCRSSRRDLNFLLDCQRVVLTELMQYLQLHVNLHRQKFIPKRISHLFDHPQWGVKGQKIMYRMVEIHPNVLNRIIDKLIAVSGDDAKVLNNQIADVFSWMKVEQPEFDHVQLKKPWSWFVQKAYLWACESYASEKYEKVSWQSDCREIEIYGYQFVPIENLWALMKLAVSERHCIDRYATDCIRRDKQVFSVHMHGRTISTLLLEKSWSDHWSIVDLRGFANKRIGNHLWQAADKLVSQLNRGNDPIVHLSLNI